MTNSSIMGSEAGLMLLAEEFDFLRDKQVLRILFAISQKGPLTAGEIIKLGLGRPYRIKAMLKYLMDEGKLVRVKRAYRPEGRRKPPKMFYQYFIGDEFIACALDETMALLERSHLEYSRGFRRLRLEMKPLF